MHKILLIASLFMVLAMVLSACGSLTVDVQPPADSGSGAEGAGEVSTTLLYGILILSGAAILIALLSLFRR